jgi:microsomal dipeptidase-like Zn-dependent dipeptidase
MKALLIVHNMALNEQVNEIVESAGLNGYTKFPNILGKGAISEPHLGTDVWPETNCGTFVVADEAKTSELMRSIRRMREKLGSEGVKAFMWEIADFT